MVGAMQALGVLHLANISVGAQRNKHFQKAMGKYGEVVQMFRSRYAEPSQHLGMTDFATCLLLRLFVIPRILTLIRKLSRDVGQLAILWLLFIAAQKTGKLSEQ